MILDQWFMGKFWCMYIYLCHN